MTACAGNVPAQRQNSAKTEHVTRECHAPHTAAASLTCIYPLFAASRVDCGCSASISRSISRCRRRRRGCRNPEATPGCTTARAPPRPVIARHTEAPPSKPPTRCCRAAGLQLASSKNSACRPCTAAVASLSQTMSEMLVFDAPYRMSRIHVTACHGTGGEQQQIRGA